MMPLAELTFSGWNWLWPAVGFLAVAVFVLVWSYRASASQPLRRVCFARRRPEADGRSERHGLAGLAGGNL
ncbi:MAG: hypothetical protein NTV51_00545 [Verrucomicrobia bacterium]|nr:hypothetical protein [Verrucomicrobiota bacterium]